MSEEFFERLTEKAMGACGYSEWEPHYKSGINATIEALKEMMVGEVIGGVVDLHGSNTYVLTGCTPLRWRGHHGTDGEEVIVLVVRLS